jgi:hypothetical protein
VTQTDFPAMAGRVWEVVENGRWRNLLMFNATNRRLAPPQEITP